MGLNVVTSSSVRPGNWHRFPEFFFQNISHLKEYIRNISLKNFGNIKIPFIYLSVIVFGKRWQAENYAYLIQSRL